MRPVRPVGVGTLPIPEVESVAVALALLVPLRRLESPDPTDPRAEPAGLTMESMRFPDSVLLGAPVGEAVAEAGTLTGTVVGVISLERVEEALALVLESPPRPLIQL